MIYIITGPSGVGKNTIINELSNKIDINFVVSHTTREIRENEVNGVDYHFVSLEKFQNMISNNEFIEFEEFNNNYYGTSIEELEKTKDKITILDLEIKGATNLLSNNEEYIGIFIDISNDLLIERLNSRGHNEDFINSRMKLADSQRSNKEIFKYFIENIDLNTSVNQLVDIICTLEEI